MKRSPGGGPSEIIRILVAGKLGWPAEMAGGELVGIIERVCTAKEVEILKLKAALGALRIDNGERSLADLLGIGREAARDRLRNAKRKILQEVAAMRGVDDH